MDIGWKEGLPEPVESGVKAGSGGGYAKRDEGLPEPEESGVDDRKNRVNLVFQAGYDGQKKVYRNLRNL